MITLVIIGGLIGYWIGGFTGLLIGAGLVFVAARAIRLFVVRRVGAVQARFLESTFAVMGAMCKADGQVTRDEIKVAEQLFDRLRLTGERRQAAKAAFDRGKTADFDLDAEVAAFRAASRGNRSLLQMFLQVQLSAIAADGVMHESERKMLLRVARGLGLPEAEIQRIEAMLRGGKAGDTEQSLANAYQTLGLDDTASDAEVKKAYRRQMSQNHPDKLAGQGLPDSMRAMAEERTREIGNAYELINRVRGQAA